MDRRHVSAGRVSQGDRKEQKTRKSPLHFAREKGPEKAWNKRVFDECELGIGAPVSVPCVYCAPKPKRGNR